MLKFYKTVNNSLIELSQIEDGCWIKAVAPTETEISLLESSLKIERDFIRSALDEEEISRIETDDGNTLIVLDYPISEQTHETDYDHKNYFTLPLSIILTEKNVVTVSLAENAILDDFSSGVVKDFQTHYKTQFIFLILLRVAGKYLLYLKQIDKLSDYIEKRLHKSMKNEELIQLLDLEKSLVYFSTSLKSTETVLEKIQRGRFIRLYEEDQDLLDDVLIEVKQAIEMSSIYSNILSGTMDAFASVISNNLNIVMKIMTIITIVMAVPTMIFSFYGMNVNNLPMPSTEFALVLSAIMATLTAFILAKSKFFK